MSATPQDNTTARRPSGPIDNSPTGNANPWNHPMNAPTGPRSQSGGSRGRNQSNGPRGGGAGIGQSNSRPNSNGPPQSPHSNNRDRSSSRGGRGGRAGFNNFGNRSSSGGSPPRGGFGRPNMARTSSTGGSPRPRGGYNSPVSGSRPGSCGPTNAPSTPFNGNSNSRSRSRGGGSQARSQSRSSTRSNEFHKVPQGGKPALVPNYTPYIPSPSGPGTKVGRSESPGNTTPLSPANPGSVTTDGKPTTDSQAQVLQATSQSVSRERASNTPALKPLENATEIKQAPSSPRPELSLDTKDISGKKKRSRRKKKQEDVQKTGHDAEDLNGEDADNEAASGSDDPVSASSNAMGFGGDLVTASMQKGETTITMIPVPGVPGGDPTVMVNDEDEDDDQEGKDDKDAGVNDDKPFVIPAVEDLRRKNSRYRLLNTRRELTTAVEQMEVYTVVVHSRAANEVVNAIKSVTDSLKEGVPDCQHLRRLVRPENLPPSLTGLPESLFVDYTTENASPPFKVNPDGSLEKRTRGSSRAQRRRRNASYRKGEKPLYVLLCPVVTMTIHELYTILSAHPLFAEVDLECDIPFEAQDVPRIVKHTVPQWAPCNQKQSNYWTEKYWPTIYRRTNPYGPHHFVVNKWDEKLNLPYPKEAMDYVDYDGPELTTGEYYMRLARKVAEEGEKNGAGLRIGCVVVEMSDRDVPKHGRVIVAAHDARIQSGNPVAHCCYRVISLVGRKRVEATSRHKPKMNIFSVNGPNSAMESDYYGRVPGDPDAYLMNDLAVFMTHEPCVMCSMAMVHSRIGCFVFGEKMASGGLHADLAPPDGHTLPVHGVTNEDVDNYRKKQGITPADLRKRRTGDEGLLGGGEEQINQVENKIRQHKSNKKTLAQKVRNKKKKAKEAGVDYQERDEVEEAPKPKPVYEKREPAGPTKEQMLEGVAVELKKQWNPIDPAIKTNEAIIDICKDKSSLNIIKERELLKYKAITDALITERETQEEEAKLRARIAAGQETLRKEHKLDDESQTAKIFDPIKDGTDQLGAPSAVNMGTLADKNEGDSKLTADRLQVMARDIKAGGSATMPEEVGQFAQTISAFNGDSTYAKSAIDNDLAQIDPMPKIEENAEEDSIVQGNDKGVSSGTKVDLPRDESPGVFGPFGGIDIDGVNQDSTFVTTVEQVTPVEEKIEENSTDEVGQKQTDSAERGRSRIPAPFKPGTGDFVPVNVSYGSPSGDSPEEFTTSGGEDTAGTGMDDSDAGGIDIGTAFDLMTTEALDTGADGEKKKKKRRGKKKRSRGKKKAAAEGEENADEAVPDDKTGSGDAEGFQIVDVKEAKEGTSTQGDNTASTTHGSSTTVPTAHSVSSHDINEDQVTGSTNLLGSRPQSPGEDDPPVGELVEILEELEAEDSGPDELTKPSRGFKLLEDKLNAGFPQYDHEPGDGYGLFWREKLNWKFVCFQYKPDDDDEWDYKLEWMGMGNDLLHA